MKIISKTSGHFRALYLTETLDELKLENKILQLDVLIREHPYFQKAHDCCSFYFQHAENYDAFRKSRVFIAREVVGTPLNLERDSGFSLLEGSTIQYLSSDFEVGGAFSLQSLFDKYQQMMSGLVDYEYGIYWRFELGLDARLSSEVHILPIEEKIFSQFVNY